MKIKTGHIIGVGVLGLCVALFFWIKNNASTIIGNAAGTALTKVTNNNDISLKEQLRNTTAQTLNAANDGIVEAVHNKTANLFNKWLKVS